MDSLIKIKKQLLKDAKNLGLRVLHSLNGYGLVLRGLTPFDPREDKHNSKDIMYINKCMHTINNKMTPNLANTKLLSDTAKNIKYKNLAKDNLFRPHTYLIPWKDPIRCR